MPLVMLHSPPSDHLVCACPALTPTGTADTVRLPVFSGQAPAALCPLTKFFSSLSAIPPSSWLPV